MFLTKITEHYTSGNTKRVPRISDCNQSVMYAPSCALDPKHKLQWSAIVVRLCTQYAYSSRLCTQYAWKRTVNLNDLKELSLSQFIIFHPCPEKMRQKYSYENEF